MAKLWRRFIPDQSCQKRTGPPAKARQREHAGDTRSKVSTTGRVSTSNRARASDHHRPGLLTLMGEDALSVVAVAMAALLVTLAHQVNTVEV